jgi:hypothetical protein
VTVATANHFLVSCRPCGCVWSLTTLPVPIDFMVKLTRRSQCPRCDSGSRQHVLANAAEATTWAQEQQANAAAGSS